MAKKTDITPNVPLLYSPAATLAKRPRDVRNQKLPAKRIVVHITGTSTYINAARAGQAPLDRVEDYFDDYGNPFSHYTVDPWGRVRQHASEQERAWSQGWGGLGGRAKLLRDLESHARIVPHWWHNALGLRGETAEDTVERLFPEGTPNDRAVSIEFIQYQRGGIPRSGPNKGKWTLHRGMRNYKLTRAQYFMGNLLCRDIALRHGIPWPAVTKEFGPKKDGVPTIRAICGFLGHEDCDPWGRGHPRAGGWDPGALRDKPRFCWYCFLTSDMAGCGCNCVIKTPEKPSWAE